MRWRKPSSRWRVFWIALGAVLLIGFAGALSILIEVNRQRQPQPRGPYLQSVDPESIWVVWDTIEPVQGRVEFGTTQDLGQVVQEAVAGTHHEVQLSGLEPYQVYHYRVDGGRTAQFRTAAGQDQSNFRFVVYGDTRGSASVHRAIVKAALRSQPDFVIHTGDLVESGRFRSEWDRFFRIEAPLIQTAPIYPTLGNHEELDPQDQDSHYFRAFHLPGNEMWYAFDYGNAHFICLKADGDPRSQFFPEAEQLVWLEEELATNQKPWLFVFFHIGLFTSREEGYLEVGLRQRLVPLFEQYGVDAVFMGHHHTYERILENGITYIVTAGGGASLYEFGVPEPGSQAAVRVHHFVSIEVQGDRLVGKAIDRRGSVIDQFELQP